MLGARARAFEAAIYPHYPRMQYELSAAWDVVMVKTGHTLRCCWAKTDLWQHRIGQSRPVFVFASRKCHAHRNVPHHMLAPDDRGTRFASQP